MLIAQISDMHIKKPGEQLYGRIDTQGYLERAVAHVNALDPRPDIALITGDLVDGGKVEEYANLKRMLSALHMPFYLIPGNHDARDQLREVFSDHAYLPRSGFLQYVVEDLPLRLIALERQQLEVERAFDEPYSRQQTDQYRTAIKYRPLIHYCVT